MQDIKFLTPCARYLVISARRSVEAWKRECESVRSWLATTPESLSEDDVDTLLHNITTPLPSVAQPVVVVHCYADVPAGTRYDIIFDQNDPDACEPTVAEVVFGVAFGKYADLTLSHGHHQTALLHFPNGLPSLLSRLPWDTSSSDYLGLCAESDFPDVRRRLKGTHDKWLNSFLADPADPR